MTGILVKAVGHGGSGLAVTANNVTKSSSGLAASGLVTTTQLPNPNVTGGLAPFEYVWEYVSGSTEPLVSDDAVANPTWAAIVEDGTPEIAVWKVTVTDAAAATAEVNITVTLIWVSTGG